MSIHPNSMAAYVSSRDLRETRRAAIIRFLREHGPATDREVMRGMGFDDMNAVRPRLTEAIQKNEAVEVGRPRFDALTGKTVRVVAAALV